MELTLNKNIKEDLKKWKGKVTFTNFLIEGAEAEKLQEILGNANNMSPIEFNKYFEQLGIVCKKTREQTFDNQIVAVGREVFTARLINELTYTGVINYGAVGTGSTAVSDSDTVLDTEVKRKGIATRSRVANTATLRFFYTKSDTNGTYEEFGTFIDGTSTVDTGVLFNRVLTGGWTKSALEAMTVTVQFDLNPQ